MTVPGQEQLVPATKRSLLILSHAMERAFDLGRAGGTGLVLGTFQRREHFDVERDRYAALAEVGHLVVVGFVGAVDDLPPGVHGVAFGPDDPRAADWILVLVRGAYATALVAQDARTLATGELTLEASRSFDARWTFSREAALEDARVQLARLASDLPVEVVAAASRHLAASSGLPLSDAEARLAVAAEHLVSSIEAGQRRTSRLRVALQDSRSLAELDQLTGLQNRHFLERYLGAEDRPVELVTLLVDVDGLKAVNDGHGHAAGDAVLSAVASLLRSHSRPGDVCVRWGGDEFLLLAPGLDGEAGLAFASRLARVVAQARPAAPWDHLPLSISIGVCPTQRTSLPLDRLDRALYEVKRSGKGHAALAA